VIWVYDQKDNVVMPELQNRLKYCEKEKAYFDKQGKNYPPFSEYIWNCNALGECKVVYIDCKYVLETHNLENLSKNKLPILYNEWKSNVDYTNQLDILGVVDVSSFPTN
jgi:hypothetical protein